MAIIGKDKIDQAYSKQVGAKKSARELRIEKAQVLRDKLISIKQECIDIVETYAYLRSKNMETPPLKPFTCSGSGLFFIKFESGEYGIQYYWNTDFQHCTFVPAFDDFVVHCVDKFNGKTHDLLLGDGEFGYYNDYYIEESIYVMSNFLSEFPKFKDNFLKYLPK